MARCDWAAGALLCVRLAALLLQLPQLPFGLAANKAHTTSQTEQKSHETKMKEKYLKKKKKLGGQGNGKANRLERPTEWMGAKQFMSGGPGYFSEWNGMVVRSVEQNGWGSGRGTTHTLDVSRNRNAVRGVFMRRVRYVFCVTSLYDESFNRERTGAVYYLWPLFRTALWSFLILLSGSHLSSSRFFFVPQKKELKKEKNRKSEKNRSASEEKMGCGDRC